MLKERLDGRAVELRSDEGELVEVIKYEPVFSMFIVDKQNNTATMTINREEMQQIYDAIGLLLKEKE